MPCLSDNERQDELKDLQDCNGFGEDVGFRLVQYFVLCDGRFERSETIPFLGQLDAGQGEAALVAFIVKTAHVGKVGMRESPSYPRALTSGCFIYSLLLLLVPAGTSSWCRWPSEKKLEPPRRVDYSVNLFFHRPESLPGHHELENRVRHDELGQQDGDEHPAGPPCQRPKYGVMIFL